MKPPIPTFTFRLILCALLALCAPLTHAGAQVEVSFVQPQDFTDMKGGWLRDDSLRQALMQHLTMLGHKGLPDGQLLRVEITDIDLAGEIEHTRHLSEIRVMRDVTSPRINLRWRLESADKSATPMTEVTLRDVAYLARINRYAQGDPLRYEKQMLDEWFEHTFTPKK